MSALGGDGRMGSYFWKDFKDPKFWLKITVIPAVGGLCLLDFLSYVFATPGYLNLWAIRIVGGLSIVGVIGYGVFLYVKPRRFKKLKERQALFEEMRKRELRRRLEKEPQYQTLCYECRHFNDHLKACSLEIINRRALEVKFRDLNDKYTYCLYWNCDYEKIFSGG